MKICVLEQCLPLDCGVLLNNLKYHCLITFFLLSSKDLFLKIKLEKKQSRVLDLVMKEREELTFFFRHILIKDCLWRKKHKAHELKSIESDNFSKGYFILSLILAIWVFTIEIISLNCQHDRNLHHLKERKRISGHSYWGIFFSFIFFS